MTCRSTEKGKLIKGGHTGEGKKGTSGYQGMKSGDGTSPYFVFQMRKRRVTVVQWKAIGGRDIGASLLVVNEGPRALHRPQHLYAKTMEKARKGSIE